jgi:pyruvate/2-oxoglutarate dehydrogenase complex dihydrolipoamide dehydrogenase (E3) component
MAASARVAYLARRASDYGVQTGPVKDTTQVLGCAILGMDGAEVMTVLQVAMMGKLPYTVIRDGIFAHPTLAESLNNLFMAMDAQGLGEEK